jgi:glycosyltransferase involved in cell wall biosynthesis
MDNNRTLIVDCQVLQTDAWDRGMGKYSLSLLAALKKENKLPTNTKLILNSSLPANELMLDELKKACPDAEIVHLDLQVPSSNSKVITRTNNKKIINSYIEGLNLMETVDFLILSLFLNQAYIVFPDNARKLLLFYDLIPLLFEKRYAARINYEDYLNHFKTIFEADIIFTISQTVADDMSVYLGIPPEKLQNINGASIERGHLKVTKPDLTIPKKFILMPSGDELRKNNLNAVRGFSEFNEMHGNEYFLVITSSFSGASQSELQIFSDHLIFSGNVSEAELHWLFNNSEFIFFPSEYEGLGLPILEAMAINKKIACSDIPVFKEISSDSFYFFDPDDTGSIANALTEALQGHDSKGKIGKYKDILTTYTWEKSVESLDNSLKLLQNEDLLKSEQERKKIAVFCPNPEGYSAIGKITAEMHAELSRDFDIDYYYDYQPSTNEHVRPDFLEHVANCYKASEFTARDYKKYDAVIYHIGNSDYHLNIIKNALYLPGFIILHETHLQGAFGELLRLGIISKDRYKLEELIDDQNKSDTSNFINSIVNDQLGILTHSEYAASAVREVLVNEIPIVKANLAIGTPMMLRRANSKKLNIGLAGILADIKGLPLIETLATDPDFSDCQFTIFGFSFIKPDTLDRLAKFDNIKIFQDPSDFEFQTYLTKLDVLINYRFEDRGETSLTVLESMRYGVIPIVRNVSWYSELPDDAVIKVEDTDELKQKLKDLKNDPQLLKEMAVKALEYVQDSHSHRQYLNNIHYLMDDVGRLENNPNNQKAELLRTTNSLEQLKYKLRRESLS